MILQKHFSQDQNKNKNTQKQQHLFNTTSSVSAQLSAAANTIYQILFCFLS